MLLLGTFALALLHLPADTTKKTDSLPLKATRTLEFETDEGTWLSLDVSPDGKTIVFELLGDIYTLPFAGGAATAITSGPPFDSQPRWSPDGRRIVFLSDRDGAENVWTIDPDGSHPKAVSKGDGSLYASPEWTPARTCGGRCESATNRPRIPQTSRRRWRRQGQSPGLSRSTRR